MNSFPIRLKEALALRDMNQSDLAKRINGSKASISQYLSGQYTPSSQRICTIAKALDVEERWLMGQDDLPDQHVLPDVLVLYNQLDRDDQMRIQGRLEEMLEQVKYKKGDS